MSRHRLSFCPCQHHAPHAPHAPLAPHTPHTPHRRWTRDEPTHEIRRRTCRVEKQTSNYLTSFALPALPPSLAPHTECRRPVSTTPPPVFAGVTGIILREHLERGGRPLERGGRPVRALLPRARVGECRWGTAKTRFGANIRRASLSFCSEESPRAHRQRVPAVMVREAWTRAHEEGCGPSLHAPRPQPYGTVMRVGALRGP